MTKTDTPECAAREASCGRCPDPDATLSTTSAGQGRDAVTHVTHLALRPRRVIFSCIISNGGIGENASGLSRRQVRHCRPPAMSRKSRDRGNQVERAIVAALIEHGFAAERVPLSDAARGRFGGDVSVPFLGIDRRVEVKARRDGFAELYRWLGDHDFLIVKRDSSEPLIVLRLSEAARGPNSSSALGMTGYGWQSAS